MGDEMTNYTPGPWTHPADTVSVFAGTGQSRKKVCDTSWGNGVGASGTTVLEAEANANLIASAPDLLAACRAHHAWSLAEKQNGISFHAKMDLCAYAEWLTVKALAKVNGTEAQAFSGVPRILLDLQSFSPLRAASDESDCEKLVQEVLSMEEERAAIHA